VPLAKQVPAVAALRWAALVLALAPVAGLAQPARRALQWEEVTVSYNPEDEAFARIALDAAKAALPTLASALGIARDQSGREPPIRIDIARRNDDFDQLVGQKTKPWVEGMALGGERRIVLKTLAPAVMQTVTAHELVHVLLDTAARELGVEPPRWLHEGLAKLSADDFTEDDREVLGQAVLGHKLIPLSGLDAAFEGSGDQESLAYAESYTLVRFLHELQPGGGVKELLANLALTGDVNRALLRTYGQPAAQLEREWLQQTQTTYLKHGIPLTSELGIFGAMAVLALAAHAVQSRRRRIIRERLQEDERLRRMFGEVADETDEGAGPPDVDYLD
jgi:hypothetical protein